MKDGSLENKIYKKRSNTSQFKRKSGDFAIAIAKVAVSQVCESVGFQSFQHSALETLSDIAVRYIYNLGKTSNFNANLAGRLESNVFDVIQALEDLESGLGFSGVSDVNRCLANSGIVRDIVHFVGDAADIPFAYDVPRFPVVKEWKEIGSFSVKGEEPHGEHIPSWLPAFPDPKPYAARSRVVNGTMRVEKKIERPLLNFEQQFARNGNEGGYSRVDGESEPSNCNPYLAAPLHLGENEVDVSLVVLPAKLSNEVALRDPVPENCLVGNQVSVLETFAPAIEAMKNGVCEYGDGEKNDLNNQRRAIHFKIGIGKKSLGTAPDLNSRNKDLMASWFEDDNMKDDRKRRAEQILRESMQCSHEPGLTFQFKFPGKQGKL